METTKRIKKVIIHKVSRLGREPVAMVKIIEQFKRYKVSVFDYNRKQEILDENNNLLYLENL